MNQYSKAITLATQFTPFLQFAALSKGLLFSEEDCWDFFAENMAPFTSSKTSVTELAVNDSSASSEKMVQTFLGLLADYMQTIKTTKKYLVSLPLNTVSLHIH